MSNIVSIGAEAALKIKSPDMLHFNCKVTCTCALSMGGVYNTEAYNIGVDTDNESAGSVADDVIPAGSIGTSPVDYQYSKLSHVSYCSWNSRALLHHDPNIRKIKFGYLWSFIFSVDICCLQETHGNLHELQAYAPELFESFHVFASFCVKTCAGGVITFLKKSSNMSWGLFIADPFCQGRALRVQWAAYVGLRKAIVWNIHNHGISKAEMKLIGAAIKHDQAMAKEFPQHISVVVVGDFNFLIDGEFRLSAGQPTNPEDDQLGGPPTQPHKAAFSEALACYTDVHGGMHTRYDTHAAKYSRLDRIFFGMPKWFLVQCTMDFKVWTDPMLLSLRGISDHAPTIVVVKPRMIHDRDSLPIPPEIFKSPVYYNSLKTLLAFSDIDKHDPPNQEIILKGLIRQAARLARNDIIKSCEDIATVKALSFSAMARAVSNNDLHLFKILTLRECRLVNVSDHIFIDSGVLTLVNPVKFEAEFRRAKTGVLKRRLYEAKRSESTSSSLSAGWARARKTQKRIRALLKLWSPIGAQHHIAGLKLKDGSIARNPFEQLEAQAEYWGPIFEGKGGEPINTTNAIQFLKDNAIKFDFKGVRAPTAHSFRTFFNHAQHSSPGRDGIPYAAYKFASFLVIPYFLNASFWITSGFNMSLTFNDVCNCFLIKGDIIPDQEVIATPETTRPIGKKNTFNKSIGGTWGNSIKRFIAASLHHAQRGMTPGRNFVNNIVDIDCMGRIFGYLGHATSLMPLLVFFDIAAAYPSLCHAFMFLVFEALCLPRAVINLYKCMYSNVAAYGGFGGSYVFMFNILAGVIQGCPLSGLALLWRSILFLDF